MQRHVEADRLGRLEINDKLERGWCLHWKLGRFLALENAINIRSRTPDDIGAVGSIGHQRAFRDVLAKGAVDRGEPIALCQCDDQPAMSVHEWVRQDDQTTARLARKSRDGRRLLDARDDVEVVAFPTMI